jgi:drug/metabolite transporter, DME family
MTNAKGSMRGKGLPSLLMIVTALLWSSGGLGIKLVSLPPLTIGGLRSMFAAPVILAPALLMLARLPSRRPVLEVCRLLKSPRVWGAAVAYAIMVLAFVFAVKLSSAANAILIQYTGPVYVALLSWPVLGEAIRKWDWMGTFGCVLGLIVFFGNDRGESHFIGNAFAVVSSLGFGALPIFLKLESKRLLASPQTAVLAEIAPAVSMSLGNILAASVCLPFVVQHPLSDCRLQDIGIIALLGVFQIGVAYILYGIAVRKLRALHSSLLACIEPVLSPLWVFLATAERPSRAALLGGGLIVASVTLQSVFSSKT